MCIWRRPDLDIMTGELQLLIRDQEDVSHIRCFDLPWPGVRSGSLVCIANTLKLPVCLVH